MSSKLIHCKIACNSQSSINRSEFWKLGWGPPDGAEGCLCRGVGSYQKLKYLNKQWNKKNIKNPQSTPHSYLLMPALLVRMIGMKARLERLMEIPCQTHSGYHVSPGSVIRPIWSSIHNLQGGFSLIFRPKPEHHPSRAFHQRIWRNSS